MKTILLQLLAICNIFSITLGRQELTLLNSTEEANPLILLPSNDTNEINDPAPCVLCSDESQPQFPDKNVSSFLLFFIRKGWPGFTGTCLEVDKHARESLTSSWSECNFIQYVAGICGCPVVKSACSNLCPIADLQNPGQLFEASKYGLPKMSCQDLVLYATQFTNDSKSCVSVSDLLKANCICDAKNFTNEPPPPELYPVLPVQRQRVALTWIPRVTGILSALGSLYIIGDILKGRRSQAITVYQELMLSMSIFDVISSIAWAFSTLPIPKEDENGDPTGIHGARGNEATCTAQGFFKQLGFTGIWYNLTLSIYYLLVIRNGVRENRLRRISKRFHLPLLIGVGLALAGIPFYDYDSWACYIPPPPVAPNYWAISLFLIVPVSLVIVVATINMVLVYLSVRKQDGIGDKWRLRNRATGQSTPAPSSRSVKRSWPRISSRQSGTLERTVFWQCVLYLGAFYLTWPILIASQFKSDEGEAGFGFWATVFALAPLQGFWNLIVYIRPRLQQYLQRKRRERASRSSTKSSSLPSSLPGTEQATNNGVPPTADKRSDSVAVTFVPTVAKDGQKCTLREGSLEGKECIEDVSMGP